MGTEKEVAFDPYHKWLGISKAHRPPTLYQLLGLSQGESDVEVIEEAAIRQMSHLRNYQVGPHADDCTKLLNEISTARQVLLKPQKRQAYEAKLAQLAAKRAAAAVESTSAFADLGDSGSIAAAQAQRDARKPTRSTKQAGKRTAPKDEPRGFPRWILYAAAAGGVLVCGALAVLAFTSQHSPPLVAPAPAIANSPAPRHAPPVVVAPPRSANVEPKPVEPKPPAIEKPTTPIAEASDAPNVRILKTVTLQAPGKNLLALADGRIVYGGNPTIYEFEPARATNRETNNILRVGPRGIRFAVSPDGKRMHVGIPDTSELLTYDISTSGSQMQREGVFEGAGEVCELGLSRDGKTLVSASYDGNVVAWNVATHEKDHQVLSHPQPVRNIVFSRDGDLVATMCDQQIHVWSLREKRLVFSAQNQLHGTSIDFTVDGKTLVLSTPSALFSRSIDRPEWTTLVAKPFLRIAFADDKTLVALTPNSISVYDWPSFKLRRHSLSGASTLETLALTPDGRVAFVGHSVPRLNAIAIDESATLKNFVPPNEMPAPGPPKYAGNWSFPNSSTGSKQIDLRIADVGGVLSAQMSFRNLSRTGKARIENLKSADGILYGTAIIDGELPDPWSKVKEIEISPPAVDGLMRVMFRSGEDLLYHPFHRTDGASLSPTPAPPPPVTLPKPIVAAPKTSPVPIVRSAVPDDAKIKDLTKTIRDTYKTDYAKKTPADRAELAEKLLKLAAESKDDPAARYILCCEARDLAAVAGNWSIVADALERIEDGFKVDVLPQKEAALRIFVKAGLTKESALEATGVAIQGIGDSIVADQMPLAGKFLGLAGLAVGKTQSASVIGLVKKGNAELKLITQEADAVKKARETLMTMPDDPAANLAVGRYDALRRGDWDAGLPLLAKGGDGELPALARKELEAPKDGAGQQKVADEWWALAEKEKDSTWVRAAMRERAALWYRQAVTLATGLSLSVMTERLKSIDESPSPFKCSAPTAAVESKTLRGHKGAVTGLDIRADGTLFSSSLDGSLKSWDLKLAKNLTSFSHEMPIHSFAFSPTGRYIAIGYKETRKVIDTQNSSRPPWLVENAVPGIFWLDDDQVCSFDGVKCDLDSVSRAGKFRRLAIRMSAVQASPTRAQVVTMGDETWMLTLHPDGSPLNQDKTPLVNSTAAAFSPKGSIAAIATSDKKISLYAFKDRSVAATLEGCSGVVRCLAYVPTGDRLLSGGDDGVVHIWDVSTGKEVRHFSTGSKGVTSIIVTPDGKQIITGGGDGTIRIWAMPHERAPAKAAALAIPIGDHGRLPALIAEIALVDTISGVVPNHVAVTSGRKAQS